MPEDVSKLTPRSPVVCIMGHVDHGKTTLLDYIRKSHLAEKEVGGITQSISAFTVELKEQKNKKIVFLDTPGHEAFREMRHHGAYSTDIILLVIAAEDGIMPQTEEVLELIKETKLPTIIAVTKCDKHEKEIDSILENVSRQLAKYDVLTELVGGTIPIFGVSGKTGLNVKQLEEAICFESEIQDYRADFKVYCLP